MNSTRKLLSCCSEPISFLRRSLLTARSARIISTNASGLQPTCCRRNFWSSRQGSRSQEAQSWTQWATVTNAAKVNQPETAHPPPSIQGAAGGLKAERSPIQHPPTRGTGVQRQLLETPADKGKLIARVHELLAKSDRGKVSRGSSATTPPASMYAAQSQASSMPQHRSAPAKMQNSSD